MIRTSRDGVPPRRSALARLVRLALSAGICGSAGLGAALANDACTEVSGTHTYQCSGNQAGGIVFDGSSSAISGATVVPTSATGLNITGLTTNITGAPTAASLKGAVVISLPQSLQTTFPIIYNASTFGIDVVQASGITVSALNQDFDDPSPPPAGGMSLVLNGPITAGGNNASGGPLLTPVNMVSTGEAGVSAGKEGRRARDVYLTLGQAVTLSGASTPAFSGTVTSSAIPPPTLPSGTPFAAIMLQAVGGRGRGGDDSSDGTGQGGGPGALTGSNVSLTVGTTWTLAGAGGQPLFVPGIQLVSTGGVGGVGGNSTFENGGSGGTGGTGGTVQILGEGTVNLSTAFWSIPTPGITLVSEGGNGGKGGTGESFGSGGGGGGGGVSGPVSVSGITVSIRTQASNSAGFGAFSLGGMGGEGGDGGFIPGDSGGGGGGSGTAGPVTIGSATQPLKGAITTLYNDSPGLIAQSIAGQGGAGGSSYGFVNFGGSGGSAGDGGLVNVYSAVTVTTTSDRSPALSVQSIGGGGGNGGDGFGLFFAEGKSGGSGGNGGNVTVTNTGNLTTSGNDSHGLYAQSIGGAGGDGGWAGGVAAVGGNGGGKSDAGTVTVVTSGIIITGAPTTFSIVPSQHQICGVGCSSGIVAQSIGGGGGNGGSSGGWFSIGGAGAAGAMAEPFSSTSSAPARAAWCLP